MGGLTDGSFSTPSNVTPTTVGYPLSLRPIAHLQTQKNPCSLPTQCETNAECPRISASECLTSEKRPHRLTGRFWWRHSDSFGPLSSLALSNIFSRTNIQNRNVAKISRQKTQPATLASSLNITAARVGRLGGAVECLREAAQAEPLTSLV